MKSSPWLLCLLLVLPVSGSAQPSGVSIERILNPLRDFEPFDEPVTAERYFPDDLERRVRRAIIDSLTLRTEQLREHVRYFEGIDKERVTGGAETSGLTPLVRKLYQGSRTDRQDHGDTPPEAGETSPSATPEPDELERAESLIAEGDVGRWNDFLNRLLGGVDLIQLASGSYVGAVVDTAFAEIQHTRAREMPAVERKALTLYERFLQRFPDHPRRAEVAEKVAVLAAKKRDVWIHRHLSEAGRTLDEGNIEHAEFHARLAALVDPEAEDVEERFREIETARDDREERRRRQLSVAETDSLSDASPEQRKDVRVLLYALARRDAAGAEEQARDMARRYAGETLGALAKDAQAVAQEFGGQHEEAKRTLEDIARTSPSKRQRKRAQTLLDSPEYNLLGVLDRARTGYHLEQVRFAVLGENFLEKNVLLGAAPVITHGVAGAATLGTANILMVSSNLLEMLSGNPVSNQTVIDAAAQYVRAHADSEKSGDVYHVLAEAYESKGHPHKALHYYRLAGKTSAEEIKELEEEAGQTLLTAAEAEQSKTGQRTLYAAILHYYPDTPAGEQAKGKLARLFSTKNRGLRLSKEFLAENPQLYGPRGLGLKATLFDGNLHNMELADAGLNIVGPNALLLHYDTPWGTRTRIHSVARERITDLTGLLRQKHYDLTALDADESVAGGLKDFLPRLMRLGRRDHDPDPADLEFIRRTGRAVEPDSPMPDIELLSEKETDLQRAYGLPTVQGSITTSGVSMRADAPETFFAEELAVGNDSISPYAGVRLPIPLLKEFIPMDFMLRARPGVPSLTPQIRKPDISIDDDHLYR